MKNSQSLKKLGLSHNQIGKQGCQALTAAISLNQSLNHLQLLPGESEARVKRARDGGYMQAAPGVFGGVISHHPYKLLVG